MTEALGLSEVQKSKKQQEVQGVQESVSSSVSSHLPKANEELVADSLKESIEFLARNWIEFNEDDEITNEIQDISNKRIPWVSLSISWNYLKYNEFTFPFALWESEQSKSKWSLK